VAGKPLHGRYYPRPNRGAMPPGHKYHYGVKTQRRLFLNTMRKTNNPIAACERVGIVWSVFEEWKSTGFLTQAMLDQELAAYRAKHPDIAPGVPSMVIKHSDQELEELGYPVGVVVHDLDDIEGWSDDGNYFDWW
jgi:hypothetical protein